ncbi:MAG: hypothetical protein M1395_08300 [Bacteroidetes bacterium]|jgi:hypothetical protein|nr:hypothetical protein [Bacteroidota bacterium]
MNLLIAVLVLFSSPKGPEAYYYNGKYIVKLGIIECPNTGSATFRLLIKSPYELFDATVDSNAVRMCLPDASLRKVLGLAGRWYIITFDAKLKVGSTRHLLSLESYTRRIHKRHFIIDVEGTERLQKPLGVKR